MVAAALIVSSPLAPAAAAPPPAGPFCPPLEFVEGAQITAGFAGNDATSRILPFGRRSVISGEVADSGGFGLPGETVCIEQRPRVPNWPYSMIGSTTTRADGRWSFKLPSGPSRSIRVNYGGDPDVFSTFLYLGIRTRATLHLDAHRIRRHRRVFFSGRIPGPLPGKRVVLLRRATASGERRSFVRRARTDAFGHFRIGYAFGRVAAPKRFVFWIVVPAQDGYPYRLGRSSKRFVRVRP